MIEVLRPLRITTARLVLRLPDEEELRQFAAEIAGRVVPAGSAHFVGRWAQVPAPQFVESFLTRRRRTLAIFTPARWGIELGAFEGERLAGQASVYGRDWPASREVTTASLVHPELRGQGLGTELRVGMLSLAFGVLGARVAWSGASVDNVASNRISQKLGYEQLGVEPRDTGGGTVPFTRLRLAASAWDPMPGVRVEGAERVRGLLLGPAGAQ